MADVAVYGAYGHTARFVVAELARRGHAPVLVGRDPARLSAMADAWPGLRRHVAPTTDPVALEAAFRGSAAVINCAGPFLDTAPPVIAAALRAGIHYLDLSAEQRATREAFDDHARGAREAGVVVVPAMAFYGGLADLLASAAARDWSAVDAIEVAVALDSWLPTAGTRLTGLRNQERRLVVSQGALAFLPDPPPTPVWRFDAPFGEQAMVALTFSEVITITRHLTTDSLQSFLSQRALQDVRDPTTPPPAPEPGDASGRSPQRFAMDVVLRRGGQRRRARASGRDIYAVSAPLVVEALERILAGAVRGTGALPAGAAFDAEAFLAALSPHLTVAID